MILLRKTLSTTLDHVRLAFAYLCEYPALPALERFAAALKRFAAARGKAQLYHETITHAYFFLIRERTVVTIQEAVFPHQKIRILTGKFIPIRALRYRETTLKSELARTVFVFPDKWR